MLKPSELIGLNGEEAAARFLKKNGYKILDRRWKCRWGELDLIVKQGNEVIFVEVKTRQSDDFGGAVAAIDRNKARCLRTAAYNYLQKYNLMTVSFRIDLIAITIQGNKRATLEHFKNIITEDN
jgi:putative endonuclease